MQIKLIDNFDITDVRERMAIAKKQSSEMGMWCVKCSQYTPEKKRTKICFDCCEEMNTTYCAGCNRKMYGSGYKHCGSCYENYISQSYFRFPCYR
mgnify:CR=1 FL=1